MNLNLLWIYQFIILLLITSLCNGQICGNDSIANCIVNCTADNICQNQVFYLDEKASSIDMYCIGSHSCQGSTLYLNKVQYINLYCNGTINSCSGSMKIISNNSLNINIYCSDCGSMIFYSYGQTINDSTFNIYCFDLYSCSTARFYHSLSHSTIKHHCIGYESCRNVLISAVTSSKSLEVNCGIFGCSGHINIYPPLFSAFNLNFASDSSSGIVWIFHPHPLNIMIDCSLSNESQVYMIYGSYFDNIILLNEDNNCTLTDKSIRLHNYIYGDDINYPSDLNVINTETSLYNASIPTLIYIPVLSDLNFRMNTFIPSAYYNDIVIICIDHSVNVIACGSSTFDFSSSQNVTIVSNRMDEMIIYGPLNSYTFITGNSQIKSNTFYFNYSNTKYINFGCIECSISSWQWGQLMINSKLYIGSQTKQFYIHCKYDDCKNTKLYIDVNPFEYQIKSYFELFEIDCSRLSNINCKNLTLYFPSTQCLYNDTYQCPEYLFTSNPTTQPTLFPSFAPTAMIECYIQNNNTYHCETYCTDKSSTCINYIDDTADIYDLYCDGTNVCSGTALSINNTQNVNIYCNGTNACANMMISINNTQNVIIHCNGTAVCRWMEVSSFGYIANNIHLHCIGSSSCAYSTFIHENPLSNISTYCKSNSACLNMVIYSFHIIQFNLYCLSGYACWETYIYAPLFQYNSTLNLYLTYWSVRNLVIYHPNIFSSTHNINIQCSELIDVDCLVYGAQQFQGLFLLYGVHLDEYCDYLKDVNCSLSTKEYIDIHYVYANLQNYPELDLINNQTNLHQLNDSIPIMIFIPNKRGEFLKLSSNFQNHEIILVSKQSEDSIYDFSLINDVTMVINQIDNITIYGPSNSFKYIEWFGFAVNSIYHLNSTKSINFPCISCPFSSHTAGDPPASSHSYGTLKNSKLYVGDSLDININCNDNGARDCDNFNLYSDLDATTLNYSLISDGYWSMSCDGYRTRLNVTNGQYYIWMRSCDNFYLHFKNNASCQYNYTYNCPQYLWTFAPTKAPTTPTIYPSSAPTASVECYTDNSVYRCYTDITNSTHEIFINSRSRAPFFTNARIDCQREYCHIICDELQGCDGLYVNASLSNTLIIDCKQNQSCNGLNVIAPFQSLQIYCGAKEACLSSQIYAESTQNIALECSNYSASLTNWDKGSCRLLNLYAYNASIVSIDCVTDRSCRDTNFYVNNVQKAIIYSVGDYALHYSTVYANRVINGLYIECTADNACSSEIHCPIDSSCSINCIGSKSCQYIDILVKDVIENELNLTCTNHTACNNGNIQCSYGYFGIAKSGFNQNLTTGELSCSDFGCCPFAESTIVCPIGSDCNVDCANQSCIGYHIDGSESNSLYLTCTNNVTGYGCKGALVQCPTGNNTICNIKCTDIGAIEGDSCSDIFIKIDSQILDEFSLICTGNSSCYQMFLSFNGKIDNSHIECTGTSKYDHMSCYRAVVVNYGTVNSLKLLCDGIAMCQRVYADLRRGNIRALDWKCMFDTDSTIATGACDRFYWEIGGLIDVINVSCTNEKACYSYYFDFFPDATIHQFDITCDGENACYTGEMNLQSGAILNVLKVNCGGYRGCYSSDITMNSGVRVGKLDYNCFYGELGCAGNYIITNNGAMVNYTNINCNGKMICNNMYLGLYGTETYLDIHCMSGYRSCRYLYVENEGSVEYMGITCASHEACISFFIDSDDQGTNVIDTLQLNCLTNQSVCNKLWIWANISNILDVYCASELACDGLQIDGSFLSGDVDIDIQCDAPWSCNGVTVDIPRVHEIDIYCNATNSCNQMVVNCPNGLENSCRIYCSSDSESCLDMTINAPSNYSYNYLDIKCPSAEIYPNNTACNGLQVQCTAKLITDYVYDYEQHQYICRHSNDSYCCPLNGITREPTETPTFNPTSDPTFNPTFDPTMNPTQVPSLSTYNPTNDPSIDPSKAPSQPTAIPTTQPTKTATKVEGDAVGKYQIPQNGDIIADSFNRFLASFEIYVNSKFNINPYCFKCFQWFIAKTSTNDVDDISVSLNDLYGNDDDAVTFYNVKTGGYANEYGTEYDIISSYIVISSIRTSHAGYCLDDTLIDNHPLIAGNNYNITLQINSKDGDIIFVSDPIEVSTAEAPKNGYCQVYDLENLVVLTPFNLECYDWITSTESSTNLTYNALFVDVPMMESFQIPDRLIIGLVGVGGFEMVALIKDNLESISCYEMNITFPDIEQVFNSSNVTVAFLIQKIALIMNTTALGANNDIAIALYSVINGLYVTKRYNRKNAAKLVEELIYNILDSSLLLSSLNQTTFNLRSELILSELSTIAQLTSNNEIVNDEVVNTLVDDYIPIIFDVLDLYIITFGDTEGGIINDLHSLVTQIERIIEHLEYTILNGNMTAQRMNIMAELLTEYTLFAAHIAIAKSLPGEAYSYVSRNAYYSKYISATKFENSQENVNETVKCGYNIAEIVVSKAFQEGNIGIFDCTFCESSIDIYQAMDYKRPNASNVVSVNIYEDYGGDTEAMKFISTQCKPYLITLFARDTSILSAEYILDAPNQVFPSCNFWNTSSDIWHDYGCFVYDFNLNIKTVTCGCLHLTSFKMSKKDFDLNANIIAEWHWMEFTVQNLWKYPTVWITQLTLFIIVICICIINPKEEDNRSILAYEDIIFEKVKQEKIKGDITGKEIEYIAKYLPNKHYLGEGIQKLGKGKGAKKLLCFMQFRLFLVYLRNDHTVWSIFQRTAGTNFSAKARLGCFFMYISTVMFATAIFYGQKQNTLFGDVIASFLISLCGTTPVFITRKIFLNSKPKIIKRIINVDEFDDIDDEINIFDEGIQEEDAILLSNEEKANDGIIKNNAPKKRLSTMKTTKEYHKYLDSIKTHKMNIKQSILRQAMNEVKKSKSNAAQIKLVHDVRITLFNTIYPLSNKCKKYAWIFLIIWTLFVVIMAMNYGIQFDLNYKSLPNDENPNLSVFDEECWQNNKVLVIEDSLSFTYFANLQESITENKFVDDYNENNTESSKWLLSIAQSFLLSVFLWQPLTVYIVTAIKIWMFSWNLRMQLAPKNIIQLCKKAINKQDPTNLRKEISYYEQQNDYDDDAVNIKEAHYIIAHQTRPLDVIGYFSNDQLFLKIDEKTGKLIDIVSDIESDDEIMNVINHVEQGENEQVDLEMVNLKEEIQENELDTNDDDILPPNQRYKSTHL